MWIYNKCVCALRLIHTHCIFTCRILIAGCVVVLPVKLFTYHCLSKYDTYIVSELDPPFVGAFGHANGIMHNDMWTCYILIQ